MEHIRTYLLKALDGCGAHSSFEDAIANWPADLRGVRPVEGLHSAWELVEHIRIAFWDMLEFSRNREHVSPCFPHGYWPKTSAPPDEYAWDKSIQSSQEILEAMKELVRRRPNLMEICPEETGKPLFRNVLVITDHNAYHVGQLFYLRKLLGISH